MQRKTKRAGNGYNESIGETFCEIRKEKGKIKKKSSQPAVPRPLWKRWKTSVTKRKSSSLWQVNVQPGKEK